MPAGAIVVKEDVAEAVKSGHLRGYGGDVWVRILLSLHRFKHAKRLY